MPFFVDATGSISSSWDVGHIHHVCSPALAGHWTAAGGQMQDLIDFLQEPAPTGEGG